MILEGTGCRAIGLTSPASRLVFRLGQEAQKGSCELCLHTKRTLLEDAVDKPRELRSNLLCTHLHRMACARFGAGDGLLEPQHPAPAEIWHRTLPTTVLMNGLVFICSRQKVASLVIHMDLRGASCLTA